MSISAVFDVMKDEDFIKIAKNINKTEENKKQGDKNENL